jgi:hypothetical protein
VTESNYQKLPGSGFTWGGPSRVWLGGDHVLLVITRGYVEVYRRFFLNDIHALIVQRTHTGKIWSAVWGVFATMFIVPGLTLGATVAAVVMFCLAAPFVTALLINVLRGPTCAFYVRTAVQMERVPAIGRVRAAKRFLARIEPLINETQGEPPPEFSRSLEELQSNQTAAFASAPRAPGS